MRKSIFTGAALFVALAASPLQAQTASSSGYALDVNQTAKVGRVVTATVDVGPLAESSGSAPPSYDVSNSVLTLSQAAALTTGLGGVSENLNTGLLTSRSDGTATGAEATATVNNANVNLGVTNLATLFGIGATTIQSTSQANSVGGLDASGSTLIEGLTLSGTALAGLTFDTSLFVNPDPNTILLNIAGLMITLNEQTSSGDGVTGIGIATNAIHVKFSDFPVGTGLTSGDIILGHSQAFATAGSVGAVPEPSTWATMLFGFGAIGAGLRRSKKARTLRLAAA